MTARRKRSALSRASKRKKNRIKRSKALFDAKEAKPNDGQSMNSTMKTFQSYESRLQRKPNPLVLFKTTLVAVINGYLPKFQREDQLAEWVFDAAKDRPLQLNLSRCERSDAVREALLGRFHRWPEAKIAQAGERSKTLTLQAEQQCKEQVQMYLQELRGKLLGGAKALFWLNVLQPLTHPASVPRPEVREVLLALLEELKSIGGIYEQLMKRNERIWPILTLPLELEPLFQGVSTLALCGHELAANEAMQILTMFAEQFVAFPSRNKRTLPIGLSVVISVGTLATLDTADLSGLPEEIRESLSKPLSMMIPTWIKVVDEVLDVLDKSLTAKWLACEQTAFEHEFKMAVQSEVQHAFERLSHARATNQLYVLRKMGGKRTNVEGECLDINIVRERGLLLVQLEQWL